MSISVLIRQDPTFTHALSALGEQLCAKSPLPLSVQGLLGGAREAFCAQAVRELSQRGHPALLLCPDEGEAANLADRLCRQGMKVLHYPERRLEFYEIATSHDTERERLFVLSSLLAGKCDGVVATPWAAMGYTMPRALLKELSVTLTPGDLLSPEELCQRLTHMGYHRGSVVEAPGQFARRGGILDLWAQGRGEPVRLEFFGDEIDRLAYFDPLTQRVTDTLDTYALLPAREVLLRDEVLPSLRHAMEYAISHSDSGGVEEARAGLARLAGGNLPLCDRFLSLIYPEGETLFDYFPAPSPVLILGTNEVRACEEKGRTARGEAKGRLTGRHLLPPDAAKWELSQAQVQEALSRMACLHIDAFSGDSIPCQGGVFGFACRTTPAYGESPAALRDDLFSFLSLDYRVVLLCDTEAQLTGVLRHCQDWSFTAVRLPEDPDFSTLPGGKVYLCIATGEAGFELPAVKLACLSLGEGQGPRRLVQGKKRSAYPKGKTILSYAELREGDFVVHEKYGIGIFRGMESIVRDGNLQDFITVQYAGTDKLFIPADRLEAITKFIGNTEGLTPSRMGGAAWVKAKSRAKGAAREMAAELLSLYAKRQRTPGIAFQAEPEMEGEFAAIFDHDLTECQETAVGDIYSDMEAPVPMDRLLCGDVGYGKTEVALRAAFRAIAAGYQVALLVPTTVLALQHYNTALSRMRSFAVRVDMLSRFRSPREQAAAKRRLARGETDLIIGTHALLGAGVKFHKLGLLIVDEEQRFGVAQKEKIKAIAQNVDVLSLSATPIPRTLNMAMTGIRDMSLLDEAPGERRPVKTYVMEYSQEAILEAIRRELARFGQVLYLYNRTENIDLVAGRLQQALPSARIAYAHGQMEREDISAIWQSLVNGEIDVLVCTTIVESGVDLPGANTLIVEDADRLGLSQLHQLRGRVGRSHRQAYAYFTYRPGKALSDISQKRLTAISEYAEFGAGFRIALRDMEIRGAGDLLGASQHGHMESVGYDLYIKLLEDAVLEEKGTPREAPFESTVAIGVDAHLPQSYISTPHLRMEVYKKISHISTPEDREDVLDELCDRFGTPPKPTLRLLWIALTRATAQRCRISSVTRQGNLLVLSPEERDLTLWAELMRTAPGVLPPGPNTPKPACRLASGEDVAARAASLLLAYEEALNTIREEQANAQEEAH